MVKITRAVENDPVVFIRMQIENAVSDQDLDRALEMTRMMDELSVRRLRKAESSEQR